MKTKRVKKQYTRPLLSYKWEKHFLELQKFKNKYGRCHMRKPENPQLFQWCSNQKWLYQRKDPKLTKEMIKRLTELEFGWGNSFKSRWEQNFAELKKYKKKYGHCNVPCISDNKSPLYTFSRWVRAQRENYNNNLPCLTPERKAKIKNLGFSFINPLKRGKRRIKDKDLLDDLKRLYKSLGKAPSENDIVRFGKYSYLTYNNHFGSIPNARKVAGILKKPVTLRSIRYNFSDTELFDELKRLAILFGTAPRPIDVKKHGKYSYVTYYSRFGNVHKACILAGIDSVK